MPNYVTNIVNINGPADQKEKLLEQIAFGGKPGTFDFNKVIPMPEGLDIPEGGITETAIEAYLSVMNPDNHSELVPGERLTAGEFLAAIQDAKACRSCYYEYTPNIRLSDKDILEHSGNDDAKTPEDLVRLGRQYLTNFREHRASTWYDWSVNNWGTKWNNDPDTPVVDPETGAIHFDTAWSMPEPIFMELSRQYPELTFDVSWADEDIGYNVGNREYRNGEVVNEYIPEFGTDEAEEMAFDIKGFADDVIVINPLELGDLIKEAQGRLDSKQQESGEKAPPVKQRETPER